jgi:hypothetical protein
MILLVSLSLIPIKISQIRSISKFFLLLFLTVAVPRTAPARALLPSLQPTVSSACNSGGSSSSVVGRTREASFFTPTSPTVQILRCGSDNKLDVTAVEDKQRQTKNKMSRIRDAIFPIYGEEKKKFFLLGSIKFFIVLALVLSRDTKDTLIVTQCGAEAIAFLKVRFLHGMLLLFEISSFLSLT